MVAATLALTGLARSHASSALGGPFDAPPSPPATADERMKFYTIEETKLSEEQRHAVPAGILGTCKPFFMVYRNGVAVGKIQGANAPELETLILENVPEAKD